MKSKRFILHVRPLDSKMVEEYIAMWKRTTVLPKRLSKEGMGEYYRLVIMNRLQNMTYDSIAKEHGISRERVRQIWRKFAKYCEKKNHSLERLLLNKLKGGI